LADFINKWCLEDQNTVLTLKFIQALELADYIEEMSQKNSTLFDWRIPALIKAL